MDNEYDAPADGRSHTSADDERRIERTSPGRGLRGGRSRPSPGAPPVSAAGTRPDVTLVLGGARSGKSRFAESLAPEGGVRRVYVATAEPIDDEMASRIAVHRARRGTEWRTVEAPTELAQAIARESAARTWLLVDCLTVWLGNLMHHGLDVDAAREALLGSLAAAPGPVVLVANEVGLGIVPDSATARAFRDHAGRLNQAVARAAGTVCFVAAGIPVTLKGAPLPA